MITNIDGYNINYKWLGEGEETIVFLQGWGTTCDVYTAPAQLLANKYRVLLFDFPGFGGSDEPKEPWGVSEYAEFFLKLMNKLEISEACLVGHSYGGRVIIKLAAGASNGFKISRIVLVDSAGIIAKKTFKQKLSIKKYKLIKKVVSISFVHKICPDLIDEWKNKQGSADYRNASPMMKQCMVKAINEDLTEYLPKIKEETLLIWGENDTATPLSDGKLMDSLIPDSGLAVIKNAGHFSFLDQPGIFNNILKSYFKF